MKTIILMLATLVFIVSCGKDNSSGTHEVNGIDANKRYQQMSSHETERKFLDDNIGLFEMELLSNKTYYLYEKKYPNAPAIIKGRWYVSGTNLILDKMGQASYLDSTINGFGYHCLVMNNSTLSPKVKRIMDLAYVEHDRFFKLCREK